MVAFDTETTGVDVETARIVTACVAAVNTVEPIPPQQWLADPGVEIPQAAAEIHGVTTEYAREHGADPAGVCAEILVALHAHWAAGAPVVAFNAAYDLTVLDRELRRHGVSDGIGEIGPVIDPLVIDRAVDRYRKGSRKLDAMCCHYGVRLDGAHDSTQDALAAARVAWMLARWFPDEVGGKTLDELMVAQRRAHEVWAVEFEAYLQRKGTPERIDPSWPIRALAVTS